LVSYFRYLGSELTGAKVPLNLVFLQCAEVSRSSRHPLGSDEVSIIPNITPKLEDSAMRNSIHTSVVLSLFVSWSWARVGAEGAEGADGSLRPFARADVCGPYEQHCPNLWHSEHVGFSPGQRAFFRLSMAKLDIKNL
jgi:hypothetical protein